MQLVLFCTCFLAFVSLSTQHDDFPNRRRPLGGPRIRGNLEVVGPFGGSFRSRIDGGLNRRQSHLAGSFNARDFRGVGISGRAGISASIKRNSPFWNDMDDGRLGGYYDGRRGSLSVKAGLHAGIHGGATHFRALGGVCGYLSPVCRASPNDRDAHCMYTFDDRLGVCAEVYVWDQCIRDPRYENLFQSMRECNLNCR